MHVLLALKDLFSDVLTLNKCPLLRGDDVSKMNFSWLTNIFLATNLYMMLQRLIGRKSSIFSKLLFLKIKVIYNFFQSRGNLPTLK